MHSRGRSPRGNRSRRTRSSRSPSTVDYFTRLDDTALCVALRFLHPEIIRLAHGLRAPVGFHGPLRDQQSRRAAGFGFELDGNARDFIEPLFAVFHVTPPELNQ